MLDRMLVAAQVTSGSTTSSVHNLTLWYKPWNTSYAGFKLGAVELLANATPNGLAHSCLETVESWALQPCYQILLTYHGPQLTLEKDMWLVFTR